MEIRIMKPEDYDQVFKLWTGVTGFAIRSIDDSKEGILRFLQRNPHTSIVAVKERQIVGTILCGHDGRRGCFYHVCVAAKYRNRGIGAAMAKAALAALKEEKINKVSLIAFQKNELGNSFWKKEGWCFRDDLNYYDMTINEANRTDIIQ